MALEPVLKPHDFFASLDFYLLSRVTNQPIYA